MAECWVVPIVDRAREARQKRVIGHHYRFIRRELPGVL